METWLQFLYLVAQAEKCHQVLGVSPQKAMAGMNQILDAYKFDNLPPVAELGGAIGRHASFACKQGQHDLCEDESCLCRHHGRILGDG